METWIQSLNDASIPFLLWLQSLQSDGLTAVMGLLTFLGSPLFYILFFPFLYWVISKRMGLRTGLAMLTANLIGDWIKWSLQMPRPPDPPVQHLAHETSPGFVSTHASNTMAVWGTLALIVRRWWFTVLAAVVVLSIGVTRLYLGVHYPADVIGGWLVGLFAIWLVMWLAPRLAPSLASWPVWLQIVAVILLGAAILILFPGDYDDLHPAGDGVRDAGLIMGALFGLIWDYHKLSFSAQGVWWKRILRFVIGIVLVLIVYLGLDIILEPIAANNWLLDQTFRGLRYGLIGFIIIGFGPWLFQRLRLA
ncbi:MAG: phosphatase PAP2 family protein [Caldilineales bacterium]|nr:phosphatase PAP2 family protein [Caldilineales bacterium]